MADTNIIKYNSRITLKYDSIDNWAPINAETEQRAWINFIPLKGEVCIINPTANHDVVNGTCLFKVGNGISTIGELPYLSALAADVHTWAKRSAAEFLDWATDKKGVDGASIYSDSPKLATQAQIAALDSRVSALEQWHEDFDVVENSLTTEATKAVTTISLEDGKIEYNVEALPSMTAVEATTTATEVQVISKVSQTNGKVSADKKSLPKASDTAYGLVKIGTEVVSKTTHDQLSSDFSNFVTDINSYREATGDKRWKDGSGEDAHVIAEHYATKGELETLSTTIGNLSNVMNFRGVVTPSEGKDDPNDDSAALETFVEADNDVPFSHGDVIVYGNKEYVYVTNRFVEFGDTQAEEQRLSDLESSVANIRSYATVTGDSGSTTASEVNDTLAIEGDDWIKTTVTTDKVTISHKDVTRTNGTATDNPEHKESFTAVKSIISDAKGHVTEVVTTTVTLPSVDDIESGISNLQNHVWRTENANVKAQAAAGAYTSTSDLTDLAKSDLTVATNDIGYIIWDCGSATENV